MFRFRAGPLRTAAALAVGFIVLRVVYRVLFGGVGGGDAVLIDFPLLHLPPPFAHVVLLGPITLGGLISAALSAVPIAAAILAFGVVASIIDMSRVFARGARGGPLSGLARALVIAWSTLPQLTDAVRSIRTARALRGERGVASLVVPVFERTIERAVAVAAAMEVRGFAAVHPQEGPCERPVALREVSIGFEGGEPGTRDLRGAGVGPGGGGRDFAGDVSDGMTRDLRGSGVVLRGVDLERIPGTLTLVVGPTGSGKSTLLHTLSGLHTHVDDGWATGEIQVGGLDRIAVPPRDTAGFVGVVMQRPAMGFATESVDDEIAFALDVRGVSPTIVAARVAEVAEQVGIRHLLGRSLRTLSAGEASLVAVASAVVQRPSLLLVDEPLADLDSAARTRVVALLDRLAHEAGVCVIVVEHRAAEFTSVADEVLAITDGTLRPVGAARDQSADAGAHPPMRSMPARRVASDLRELARHAPSLEVVGLSVAHGTSVAVTDAELAVDAGEIVAIQGPNGAGKSSLLEAIARPRQVGQVIVSGTDAAQLRRSSLRARVALVPDDSDDLLFCLTVDEECRRNDRTSRLPRGTTAGLLATLLPDLADGSARSSATRATRDTPGTSAAPAARTSATHATLDTPGTSAAPAARTSATHATLDTPGTSADPAARVSTAAPLSGTRTVPRLSARIRDRHPRDLSVGQRRCLVLAVQLAAAPAVLLVDEPTRGLDPVATSLVASALRRAADVGAAVVIATHDAEFADAVADRRIRMQDGRLATSEAVVT
ncbi:ATP-binding cassette domain-containing protein [Glaciibacter flavus]|uniref:ATP-binding cassette domain-containing protein n=1 Tax=Orlajensenia flava TaxID=2565934 RepID=UPI003B00185A